MLSLLLRPHAAESGTMSAARHRHTGATTKVGESPTSASQPRGLARGSDVGRPRRERPTHRRPA